MFSSIAARYSAPVRFMRSHCAAAPEVVCSFASASDALPPKFTLMPVSFSKGTANSLVK